MLRDCFAIFTRFAANKFHNILRQSVFTQHSCQRWTYDGQFKPLSQGLHPVGVLTGIAKRVNDFVRFLRPGAWALRCTVPQSMLAASRQRAKLGLRGDARLAESRRRLADSLTGPHCCKSCTYVCWTFFLSFSCERRNRYVFPRNPESAGVRTYVRNTYVLISPR